MARARQNYYGLVEEQSKTVSTQDRDKQAKFPVLVGPRRGSV